MVVTVFDIDDPEANISTHVNLNGCTCDQDARIDWQGELMFGRLPHDRYGRPQLGSCSEDAVDAILGARVEQIV